MVSLSGSLTDAVASGRQSIALDVALVARLTDMAGDLAVNLLIAAVILAATVIASRWAARGVRRALSRVRGFRHDPTVLSFAVQVVRVAVYGVGIIAILQRLGVQTTSIIAVLGAASLAIGLALQGTLSNVAAGVLLLVLRPYRVGDIIQVAGVTGSVQRLDLFVTQMVNPDNHKIVVPNAKVLGDVITNLSGQKTRRVEIAFGVGYEADLKQARDVIAGVASAHDKVLAEPAPWTGVTNLLDSSVEITLHAWVKVADWWQTRADLKQGVKEALDAASIEIPFPHQVAITSGPPAVATAGAVEAEPTPVVEAAAKPPAARRPSPKA